MTSPSFNFHRAAEEMAIFDALPSAIREAINSARGSVRASSARDALLRGVPKAKIIEVIMNSQYVVTKGPEGNQS